MQYSHSSFPFPSIILTQPRPPARSPLQKSLAHTRKPSNGSTVSSVPSPTPPPKDVSPAKKEKDSMSPFELNRQLVIDREREGESGFVNH